LLRLTLFGPMQVQDASGRSVLLRSRKTRAVLAVLALAGPKPVLRTRLTGLLWSRRESEQARASLRQSVHELRVALGPDAGRLQADRNHLMLLDDRLWVDVRLLAEATVANPEDLELFQRTLLDDLVGLDPAFDHWLGDEHQRLARHARSVAEGVLAEQYEADPTVVAAERLLFIDPIHEGAWQALIRAHMEKGDRAAARLVFDRCTAILANAGLAASVATEELVGSMLRGPMQGTCDRFDQETRGIRLAVLPPRALERDQLEALSLGLAEEITAALLRFRWISCVDGTLVAGNGGLAKLGHPWQRLGLDFLLDTTLQRSGNRIRIIARLLDVRAGGTVIWARRFDRDLSDVLTLQDQIAAETAAQIDPELLLREGESQNLTSRGSREPTAYSLTLRAIPAIYRLEPSGFQAAGEMLAAALAIEPDNAAAHAWWGYWHVLMIGQGWADDPAVAAQRAGDLAERAVTLDPADARALALAGHIRGFLCRRPEEACSIHDRAITLNPSLPLAWCLSGVSTSYLGRHEEAIAQLTQAERLSPQDPHAFFFDSALMLPHLLCGDFETAVTLGRRAIERNPSFSATYKACLSALGHLGRDSDAARVLARLLALEPGFSVRDAIERSPLMRRQDLALYAEGLRRGGLREG
jgi:DNA-binding SARP family transcriptional activator